MPQTPKSPERFCGARSGTGVRGRAALDQSANGEQPSRAGCRCWGVRGEPCSPHSPEPPAHAWLQAQVATPKPGGILEKSSKSLFCPAAGKGALLPARTAIAAPNHDPPAAGMESTATRFCAVLWAALRSQGDSPTLATSSWQDQPQSKRAAPGRAGIALG